MTNMTLRNHNHSTHATTVEGNMPNDSVQHMARNVASAANSITLQNTAEANLRYSVWAVMNMMTVTTYSLLQYQKLTKQNYKLMSATQHWMLRRYLLNSKLTQELRSTYCCYTHSIT